jgi:hypothetical protein
VEAGVLLYAKVVDQDNINDMLAAYRYDEDKQDFLTRVRASVSAVDAIALVVSCERARHDINTHAYCFAG